jgi:hypothetical protein
LTFDHSLVWEMTANGQFRDADAASHFPKNIITRSLGPNANVQVDLEGPFPVAVGDTFLLCSDGLTGQVKDEELGMILNSMPPREAVRALIDLANLRGGPDNITVEVARVTGQHIAPDGQAGDPTFDSEAGEGIRSATWLWGLLALLLTTAAAAIALGQHLLAAVPVGLCLLVAAAMLARGRGRKQAPPPRATSGPLGRGPYVSSSAAPTKEFVDHLAGVCQQLRDAATNKDWTIDWSRLNGLSHQAEQAASARDWPGAVANYCRAISFLMGELPGQQRKKKPADEDESAAG